MLAPVFAQARSRLTAFAYMGALLAERGDRRSCWQLAEQAGHATPRRMQALLAEHAWDWKAALAALQRFILARLGDGEAVVVLDETAELKKGQATVGAARQYAGITGQVENCQAVVFAAYVTACAHALFDFRLYLPKAWCRDEQRRQREECLQQEKGQTGLDQHQVRTWYSFHRHTGAVHVRPGAAGRRRRPPGPGRRGPSHRHRRPARGLARHRESARQRERPATRRRPRPGQGQRPRGPPLSSAWPPSP